MTPEELVVTVDPLISAIGSSFYIASETAVRAEEIGLSRRQFYFLGRGGVLGDVKVEVVQSAFGFFAPRMVAEFWSAARASTDLGPQDVGRLYVESARDFGRRNFLSGRKLKGFCQAAERVVESVDPAGLALFAALAAEPLPDDLPGRTMQLVMMLRELRGGLHLLAVVASGVSPRLAHYYRRPDRFASFGYTEDEIPRVGPGERDTMASCDAVTDRLMAAAYRQLTAGARNEVADGTNHLAAQVPLSD
jgi:helix-turn-helix protein